MRQRIGFGVLAAAALGVVTLWVVGASGAQVVGPGGKPVRVAVVNLKQLRATCKHGLDLQADLDKRREARVKEVDSLRDDLRKAEADLEVLRAGSRAWQEQKDKVLQLQVRAEVQAKLSVAELAELNFEYTKMMFKAITDAVADYAGANGIDVVLRADDPEVGSRNMQDLMQEIALRNVLYAAPAVDITEDVRRALDRAYDKQKAGKS